MYQLLIWYTVHLVLVHKNSVHQGALVYQFLTTAVHNMYRIIIPEADEVVLFEKNT